MRNRVGVGPEEEILVPAVLGTVQLTDYPMVGTAPNNRPTPGKLIYVGI